MSVNSFVNNLIGDGTFDERNGNFAADPLFSDSSILDLSVQAASPAVDAGGDSPESSPVDLFSHQRILDGDGDGKARVDLGAIEFGSKFWTARILPVLSLANQEFVGLAMVNGSQDPAGVVLRHYSLDGELIGTFEAGTLAPGNQKALLLGEAFDSLQNGWIQILSDQPDLMSVTLLGNHGLTFLDGAALSPVTSGKLVFPEVRSGGGLETHLYLINPNTDGVTVTLNWVKPDSSSSEIAIDLPSGGMFSKTFAKTFGEGTGGYVTATTAAGEPLCGMEILARSSWRGGLSALDYMAGETKVYAAQLASSDDFDTTINVINTGPLADLTLVAFDDRGQEIQSVVVAAVPPGGQFRERAGDIFDLPSDPFVGWLRVEATGGTVLGNISFSDPKEEWLAVLPLQSHAAREFVLGQIADTPEIFSGVALLNPSSNTAMVSVEVFDPSGQRRGTSLLEIASGHKTSRLFAELIPDLGVQAGGFVRVRSSAPVLGFEIFGGRALEFMSAVTQQNLAP